MHQSCRSCGAKELVEILDLGFAPPSNALLSQEDLSREETYFPLVLLFCQECKLVQTRDFHSGKALFTANYPYLSSTSKTWVKHSHELVDSLISEFNLNGKSVVAEIASNDGYLLERLAQRGIPSYGVEPTKLAAEISLEKGHNVYNCFLNLQNATRIRSERGTADLIIAINVFAHVPDLQDFTQAAKSLLSQQGILIIEVQYLGQLLEDTLFDTIYHEHYSYFSLTSLNNLLKQKDIGIFKVEFLDTHGGSIRVYARNNTECTDIHELVTSNSHLEESCTTLSDLLKLQGSVDEVRHKIQIFFSDLKKSGRIIAGIGAAAKGNTLLNSLKFGTDQISLVFDSATSKQGKFLPGSHIPIYPMNALSTLTNIDVLVILPWNLTNELLSEIKKYQKHSFLIYKLLPKIESLNL